MNVAVVDVNSVYQCFGFLKQLSGHGVQIVVPRAVREELSGAADKALDKIKRGSKERKWRSVLNIWPELQELLKSGAWKEVGSVGTGWIHELARICNFTLPRYIPSTHIKSFQDLRVLATCIALKQREPNSVVQLLTYDKYVKQRIFWLKEQHPTEQYFDVIVPNLYFNRRKLRMEFDLDEVLDPVIKKFPKEIQDVRP